MNRLYSIGFVRSHGQTSWRILDVLMEIGIEDTEGASDKADLVYEESGVVLPSTIHLCTHTTYVYEERNGP